MKIKMFNVISNISAEQTINNWLNEHPNITIISTNTINSNNTYIILYTESDVGNDADKVD